MELNKCTNDHIEYSEYLAEYVDENNSKFLKYCKDQVDMNIKYSEYLAESINGTPFKLTDEQKRKQLLMERDKKIEKIKKNIK